MKQKIFLTSFIAMGVIAPAMAEPSNTGTFPSDGYMEEDYTYTNAATSTNMDGVYEGTVNAVAEYDIIDYIVNAGQYLPADSETVITCPAGSYCPGISGNVQYNQTTPQGIQTCPSDFGSSTAGSSSDTQCYRACDINNMGTNGSISSIAHATAISGNDYYGSGTDTCEPTACENGYHLNSVASDLVTIIGSDEAQNYVSNDSNGDEDAWGMTAIDAGIEGDPMAFAVDYGENGILYGHGRCSTEQGDNNNESWTEPTVYTDLYNETGETGAEYCYCQIDGYTSAISGQRQYLESPWVFNDKMYDVNACANGCAGYCTDLMRKDGLVSFRTYILGYTHGFYPENSGPATCEANTITINWSDAAQTDIDANNAGTATYGSDVRTPVKAKTIKGKTFKGWRFSAPEQTTTGN